MSDDEIASKFLRQVGPLLGEVRGEELLQTLWSLETESSLDRLLELMVPPRS